MSLLQIAIIFGIVLPIYNVIANALSGVQSESSKKATHEWVSKHLVASIIGVIMKLAIPIAYWVLVIIYLA